MSTFQLALSGVLGALAAYGLVALVLIRDGNGCRGVFGVRAQHRTHEAHLVHAVAEKSRTTKVCEWAGSISGLAGAGLLASKGDFAGYGFVAFLASNIGWLYYGLRTRTWSLVLMQSGFTVTSLVGIKNWLLP